MEENPIFDIKLLSNQLHYIHQERATITGGTGYFGIKTLKHILDQGLEAFQNPSYVLKGTPINFNNEAWKVIESLEEKIEKNPNPDYQSLLEILRASVSRTVLYISAEKIDLPNIGTKEESQAIDEALSDLYFEVKPIHQASLSNLQDEWEDINPQIVVFSCHGVEEGLFLTDGKGKSKLESSKKIHDFFSSKPYRRHKEVDCVILSACDSHKTGQWLSKYFPVICVDRPIDIDIIKAFKIHFFNYVNRHVKDTSRDMYESAFNRAIEKIKYEDLGEYSAFHFL